MKPYQKTVPISFRTFLAEKFTELKNNTSYWGFLAFLMFSETKDSIGKLIVTSRALAEIEGKQSQYRSKNYAGYKFLNEFSERILRIEYSDFNSEGWKGRRAQSRVIRKIDWPQDVLEKLNKVIQNPISEETRVYMTTGEKWTERTAARMKNGLREEAKETLKQMAEVVPTAKSLINYLNSLPTDIFNPILINLPQAVWTARELDKDSEGQLKNLASIADQIVPVYQPTIHSTRIFTIGESIATLNRDVRKKLTWGWKEFDLRSAQFAIVSTLWKVRKAKKFLEQGGNIWQSLLEFFELEKTSVNKQILKTALYSICFGATWRKTSRNGDPTLYETLSTLFQNPKDFLKHPIIKSLWRARTKRMKQIRQKHGAYNCFGQFLSLESNSSERSILAQEAQAYELLVLWKLIEYVVEEGKKEQPDFYLTLFQHDGFSCHFLRNEFEHVQKMKQLVKECASSCGIITELE